MAAVPPKAILAIALAAGIGAVPPHARCAEDEMLMGGELILEIDEGFAKDEAPADAAEKAEARKPDGGGRQAKDNASKDKAPAKSIESVSAKAAERETAVEADVPTAVSRKSGISASPEIKPRNEGSPASRGLIMVPAPEVLAGHLDYALSLRSRYFLSMPEFAGVDTASQGLGIKAGIGIYRRVEIGIEGISSVRNLDHMSGYIRALVFEETRKRPAVGVGIMDLTMDPKPNADVAMPITELGSVYTDDNKTNNSLYLVLAKRIPPIEGIPVFGRGYLGIGRGRFVARYGAAENLHGVFGGGELDLSALGFVSKVRHVRNFRLLAEIDGRSLNAGMDFNLLPMGTSKTDAFISIQLAARHLQHLRPHRWDIGLRPALVGRLEVVMRGKSIAPGTVETITLSPPPAEPVIDIEAAPAEAKPQEPVIAEEEVATAPAAAAPEISVDEDVALEEEETKPEAQAEMKAAPPPKPVKAKPKHASRNELFDEFIQAGIAVGETPPHFDGEVTGLTDPEVSQAKVGEEIIVTGGYSEGSQFAVYGMTAEGCKAEYLGNVRILGSIDETSNRAVIDMSRGPIMRGNKLMLMDSVFGQFERQREEEADELPIKGQIGCLPEGRKWIHTGETVMQINAGAREGVLYGQIFELIVPGGVGKRTRARVIRVDDEASFLKLINLYQPISAGDWMHSVPPADGVTPPKP